MHGSIPVKILMHSWTADGSSDKGQFHQSPRGTSRKDILYHLVSHSNIQWYMVLVWLIISVYYLLISTPPTPKYSQSHCKSGSWLGIPAQAQALQPPAACPVTLLSVYWCVLHDVTCCPPVHLQIVPLRAPGSANDKLHPNLQSIFVKCSWFNDTSTKAFKTGYARWQFEGVAIYR